MRLILPILFATGCAGSWTNMGGSIDGADFSHPRAAYHGGDFIVFAADKTDCRDLGWVDHEFIDGEAPAARDFTALLLHSRDGFSTDVPIIDVGFSGVRVWGLVQQGAEFDAHHGREGTVTIDSASEDAIEGTLSVSFATDGVGGLFKTEFCQVLDNAS